MKSMTRSCQQFFKYNFFCLLTEMILIAILLFSKVLNFWDMIYQYTWHKSYSRLNFRIR